MAKTLLQTIVGLYYDYDSSTDYSGSLLWLRLFYTIQGPSTMTTTLQQHTETPYYDYDSSTGYSGSLL
jgi:hypothetical protein